MKTPLTLAACTLALLTFWASAQDNASPPNDYVKRQTFKGQAFSKDNNIWVYNPAFAEQFGMPANGINAELKGLEAAAFRVEDSSNVKTCGIGGKEDACLPGGECMLDLYIDEAKHPLPWREPDQRADWVNRYSSLFWIKVRESHGGLGNYFDGVGELIPFIDAANKQILRYYAKSDREFDKRSEMYGWARYAMRINGYRRAIANKLALVNFSIPCWSQSKGDNAPSAHYLFLGASKDGKPVDTTFHQATLPLTFTEHMNTLLAQASALNTGFIKSIILPATPSNPIPGETK